MSWVELLPDTPGKSGTAPVSITINKETGRFRQRMILTIRVKALDNVADWCKPGASVAVQRGTGSDAGSFRLRPAGPWRFRNSAGHIKAVSISLPAPPGAPNDGCKQTPVGFLFVEDQLQFTLPPWGVAAARGATPAAPKPTPPLPPEAPARYVGISQRIADPAQALQLAHGGRVR